MNKAKSERWAIVGGGILGMTLAYRLGQQGKQVTLFESTHELGGLASAWTLGDVVWDRHYHVTLLSDTYLRCLLKELGLAQEMQWVETKTGVYADGQIYSVSNTLEFFRFPPLGLIDKLRLALTIIYGSKLKNWQKLEQIAVADWLKRLSGKRTWEKFWLPLLRSKLGENYQKTSAAFIWATIARLYAARRTGLKKEMFGYLPGGYARMLARFAEVLQAQGIRIQLGQQVTQVRETSAGNLQLAFTNQEPETYEQVILTVPTPIAAQICQGLTSEETARLQAIQYQGIICASLLLKKPLSPYYVTNITESWVPFTGIIEMSALVDPQDFGGHSLVYLPKYVTPDEPICSLSDREIESLFLEALGKIYPHFNSNDVLSFRLSRVKYVLAIPTLNYSRQLPSKHTSISGVYIINSAHIVNGTLNVNETVQLAENYVCELLKS